MLGRVPTTERGSLSLSKEEIAIQFHGLRMKE